MKLEKLDGGPAGDNLSKDETYSRRFWNRMIEGKRIEYLSEYLKDKRRAMMGIISDAVNKQNGCLSIFVNRSAEGRFDDQDREQISAFRELAKEMGYVLGPMTHNGENETASGFLTKIKP